MAGVFSTPDIEQQLFITVDATVMAEPTLAVPVAQPESQSFFLAPVGPEASTVDLPPVPHVSVLYDWLVNGFPDAEAP